MGFGVGTYLGQYGGLFHLLNHALAKALLFFAAGSVEHATGERRLSQLGGLRRLMPVTSLCFLVGALALGGMPGLNGFASKFTIFLAVADRGLWPAAVAAVVTGLLTLYVLVRAGLALFWGKPSQPPAESVKEVPNLMLTPMIVLAALCLLLGCLPLVAHQLVGGAAQSAVAATQAGTAVSLAGVP
jgi:formate hydrogenlyase subunit 3/multisubunit Na+/H+ antiporter MnhD subunit